MQDKDDVAAHSSSLYRVSHIVIVDLLIITCYTFITLLFNRRETLGVLVGKRDYILDTEELRAWIRVLEEPAGYGYAEMEPSDCPVKYEPSVGEPSTRAGMPGELRPESLTQHGSGAGSGLSEVVQQGVLAEETTYSEHFVSPTPPSSLARLREENAGLEGHCRVTQACCDHIPSLVQGVLDLVKAISSNTSVAPVTMSAASEPIKRASTNKQIDVEKSPQQKKRLRPTTTITTGTQSRLIRVRDAPRYLGMDKNRFNAEVRPNLTEIVIGLQGIAFDRLDLDCWADDYKIRNGRPGKQKGTNKLWDEKQSPVSSIARGSGTSTKLSEEDAFAKALVKAKSNARKSI